MSNIKNKILLSALIVAFSFMDCSSDLEPKRERTIRLSRAELLDKIKGAWAMQTIGVTYGDPTEFVYLQKTIPDSVEIEWNDSLMYQRMTQRPGTYDDIYMDLAFVQVLEEQGLDAPAMAHAEAYANSDFLLWHANQQGRYNFQHGIMPPASGHWLNNPHADDIDFQIEADFAGIMSPGMPNAAAQICDTVGHIMNYGDGYYGGVMVAGMYSYAFVMDDVKTIIERALQLIPKESNYYQCIKDVLDWHKQNPKDWRATWQKIEDKWGVDVGCPGGVGQPFNIDAKLNSAYVILGLLYGEGDVGKSMEIATRAGQDSDCNPATAAGILGTIKGYEAIPAYWSSGLPMVEDLDFKFTTLSLSEVYQLSYSHALKMIERNGGEIHENEVRIKVQEPKSVPLEQGFPDYRLVEKREIHQRITNAGISVYTTDFNGIGVVLRGKVGNTRLDNKRNRPPLAEIKELREYEVKLEGRVDGKLVKTMSLPIWWMKRSSELFFQYELAPGNHELSIDIQELPEDVYVEMSGLLVYEK